MFDATEPSRKTQTRGATGLLADVRSRARSLLVIQHGAMLLAWFLAITLILGAADYFLRMPVWLMGSVWLLGIGAVSMAFVRSVWPAIRFSPSLTEVALRVERSEPGRQAGLPGVLASGVELSGERETENRLATPVIADAERRAAMVRTGTLVKTGRTWRSLAWVGAAAAAIGLVSGIHPELAAVGSQRVLWPWGGAQWPKRTGLVDATGVAVHPLGTALPLRAVLTKTDGNPDSARVAANYRVLRDGRAGPVQRVLLTSQERPDERGRGRLYERLIEPTGLSSLEPRGKVEADERVEMEYWFETFDDSTELSRVLLVEPPRIVGASVEVIEPEYVRAEEAAGPRRMDLGPGSDERAAPAPMLVGSRLRMTLNLNKTVPALDQIGQGGPEWVRATLGEDAAGLFFAGDGEEPPTGTLGVESAGWVLEWTLARTVRLDVKVTDEHGIVSAEESAYRFEAIGDNPPAATVVDPREDKSVLSTAVIDFAGEGRDDVAVMWVALETQVARRPTGSEGAAPEPIGDRQEVLRREAAKSANAQVVAEHTGESGSARSLIATQSLDLSTMDLRAGDELWLTAVAADAYELAGVRHEATRSAIRRLRIMSRDELIEQVWSELGGVRRAAIKIDEEQEEAAAAAGRAGPENAERAQRAQAGITERVARQRESVERVGERIRENGLTDQTLDAVLREAEASLSRAGERSVDATDALANAAREESNEGAPQDAGQAERKQAAEAQETVREELQSLIEMLDQGEDTWAAKRSIESLIQQQKDLKERTGQAGEQTVGREMSELTPQERQTLEQIAQEQQAAAQATNEAIREMQERAEEMKQKDPAAAQAMQDAAKAGQRQQASEKMQQASQQVQQNQTSRAQQQQQQAIDALEEMLEQLEQGAKNRDEVLRRFLASLMDSIQALIAQQEAALKSLTEAEARIDFGGLAPGMIRLHQNTLGVLADANAGPRETAPVAGLIGRAAEAQARAVVALKDEPVEGPEVRAQENESLDRLKEALELAQKLDEDAAEREQNRKRAEIRKEYQALLKGQVTVRESSIGLVGAEPNRRNKAQARQVGEEQTALRDRLARMKEQTRELSDAKVFEFAHTRLDALMGGAAESLAAGTSDDSVVRRQAGAVRVLQALVDALDQSKKDKPFREAEQDSSGGGGGGGGEQPLVPPAAELKLLRAMQQEAMELTRAAADGGAKPAEVEEIGNLQGELSEQAKSLLERVSRGGGSGAPPTPTPPGSGEVPEPGAEQPEPSDPAQPGKDPENDD